MTVVKTKRYFCKVVFYVFYQKYLDPVEEHLPYFCIYEPMNAHICWSTLQLDAN